MACRWTAAESRATAALLRLLAERAWREPATASVEPTPGAAESSRRRTPFRRRGTALLGPLLLAEFGAAVEADRQPLADVPGATGATPAKPSTIALHGWKGSRFQKPRPLWSRTGDTEHATRGWIAGQDLHAQFDAVATDVHTGTGDDPVDGVLMLPAEGTVQPGRLRSTVADPDGDLARVLGLLCHRSLPPPTRLRHPPMRHGEHRAPAAAASGRCWRSPPATARSLPR